MNHHLVGPSLMWKATRALAEFACALILLAAGQTASGQARSDFNGDGFDDLAIGANGATVNQLMNAGEVIVVYGSPSALTVIGNQLWNESMLDCCVSTDQFGYSLVAGDFNGDGDGDLAIGAPTEFGSAFAAGAVFVLYGSPTGLTSAGFQKWDQNSPGVLDQSEASDTFGFSLAAADFNGDGRDDLAIGVRNEDISSVASAGSVNVLYGSEAGLTASGTQFWNQELLGLTLEAGAEFGYALAADDFDGDGNDDLAVGVPYADVGAASDAGVVNILYGSSGGLSAVSVQVWSQDEPGVEGVAESNETFGLSLVSGDFNGDGRHDLAVGVEHEDVGGMVDAGAVHVLHGSAAGLSSVNDQYWTQDDTAVRGVVEAGDLFGSALVAGEFTGDGRDELIVGASGEDESRGALHALKGTTSGLLPVKFVTARVLGGAESGDQFGIRLGTGDFNGDGLDDLAVGVPRDDVAGVSDAGSVTVFAARQRFPRQFWHEGVLGYTINPFSKFGVSLSHD